ncbi:MAG: MerR family transcriptional regulator [Rhizobiales bacterium]|nr:MerR family transcriptional regulator [Hyphomicrobiales bacterium]
MDKAPDAFRTISEVADDLDIPQHVLRFWETRFAQIKPMKRSGGRRYYRPDDVNLLRGIRRLLYGEGYTIRGVQRILREHGIKAVQNLTEEVQGHSSAIFDAPEFDSDTDAAGDFELENDETVSDDRVHEPERNAAMRGSMNFKPASPLRDEPRLRDPAPPPPVTPKQVMPKPADSNRGNGTAGAAAYAPPSVRNTARPGDQGKLKAALDDLIGARALIDRVLKDN